MTLLIIFALVTLSLMAFANEVNKRRNSFFDFPFFGDSTLESAIEHFENRMSEFSSFSQSSMFKTEWQQSKDGRTIYINPSDKDQKLDIKIENGMIQIKSAQEKSSDNMRSQSVSTQMMSIPHDCDANKAQISQMDDGVKIFFPFKGETKEISPDRIPIKPSDDSVDI
ncbi:MAG TPA: hypothetical protein VKY27_01745 [Bacteriovoracaceae bacterium]|nr:hypothetical protein [Bacteriovoracaceae bacterium]